jgi:hypothetical protein
MDGGAAALQCTASGCSTLFRENLQVQERWGLVLYRHPPKEKISESEEIIESGKAPPPSGRRDLLADHQSRNAIEAASAATVAVKTAMGYRQRFFYLYCRPHHHQQTRGAHPGIPGQTGRLLF